MDEVTGYKRWILSWPK